MVLSHLYQRWHSIIILKPPVYINAPLYPVSGSPPFPRLLSSCQTASFSLRAWGSTRRVEGLQRWQTAGLFWSDASACQRKTLSLGSLPPTPGEIFCKKGDSGVVAHMRPPCGECHAQVELGEYQLATRGLPGAALCREMCQSCQRVTFLILAWRNTVSGGALPGLAVRGLLDCLVSPRTAVPALPGSRSPHGSAPTRKSPLRGRCRHPNAKP